MLFIAFLPRSKRLLISWLQSPSAVIWEPCKIKSDTVSIVSPSISHEVMGPDAMILVFWMLSFEPTFSLSLLYAIWVVSSEVIDISLGNLDSSLCFMQAMVFPVVMYGCESWTIKKAKRRRIEAFEFLFTFCQKGGVICISEVIDISPSNLDSSLCTFLMMLLCI